MESFLLTLYFQYGNIAIMETLNQREAAKFLDISEGYLSKILSGKSVPRPYVLKKLTKKTKSDVTVWLFGDRTQKENAIKKELNQSEKAVA